MQEAHDFFSASVGAAAAFIGLLFVAVTLAPERIFGRSAHPTRRADATRAFVALGNCFFVSLAALMPRYGADSMLVFAAISIVQLVRDAYLATKFHPIVEVLRSFGIVSSIVYAAEFYFVLRLRSGGTVQGVVFVVLGLFAYALATSWGLLGAREMPAKES